MDSAAAALASYVLWLLAFPMDGFLAEPTADPYSLLFFLVPHALALVASGLLLPAHRLRGVALISAGVTALVTGAFPWLPLSGRTLLVAAGLGSAPLVVRVGVLLKSSVFPNRSAAWGLIVGNLLLGALLLLPLPVPIKALLLAAAVALPGLLSARPASDPAAIVTLVSLRHYLPFILAFHLVSGLFYGRLLPAYQATGALPGLELLFYAAAVLGALYGVKASVDGSLGLGIPLGLLALLLFREQASPLLHLSMFAMQASAGFMDAFVLFLLLARPEPVRAFGIGLGAMCLGIAGGKVLSLVAGGAAGTLTAVGNAALNLALLSLYFAHRRAAQRHLTPAPEAPAAAPSPAGTEPAPSPYRVSPGLRARLSTMEGAVLERVLAGRTFREVAAELQVSESSVKTYMKRLYEKAEVRGKADLLAKLTRGSPAA